MKKTPVRGIVLTGLIAACLFRALAHTGVMHTKK